MPAQDSDQCLSWHGAWLARGERYLEGVLRIVTLVPHGLAPKHDIESIGNSLLTKAQSTPKTEICPGWGLAV
jgi:hypothetical protein